MFPLGKKTDFRFTFSLSSQFPTTLINTQTKLPSLTRNLIPFSKAEIPNVFYAISISLLQGVARTFNAREAFDIIRDFNSGSKAFSSKSSFTHECHEIASSIVGDKCRSVWN